MKVSPLPGSFPLGDMLEPSGKERLSGLKLRSKLAAGAAVRKPNFPDLLKLETEEVQADEEQMEQGKVDLLAVAIRLVMTSAEMYSEVEAFVEVFQPLLELMKALQASKIPKELKVSDKMSRVVTVDAETISLHSHYAQSRLTV
jgi:nucleolar protein 14